MRPGCRAPSFRDRHVVPNFPPAHRLVAFCRALLAYHERPSPICVIRGPVGSPGAPWQQGGLTIVNSDNSPGRWLYLRALDETVDGANLPRILKTGKLPVLWAAKGEEKPRWTYGHQMSYRDKQTFSAPRLKHCHIESALKDAPDVPKIKALRNLCPLNHFLFPMPKHFVMRRVGWSEHPAPADGPGESPAVIAWAQDRMVRHLGDEGAEVYRRYLRAVRGTLRELPADGLIEIVARDSSRRTNRQKAPRQPTRRRSPATIATAGGDKAWWARILEPAHQNPRAAILNATPDAQRRLQGLQAGLTTERFVGIANALYNRCNPTRLEKAAPGALRAQAALGWGFLEAAKRDPSLGGKWSTTVEALEADATHGLAKVASLDLDAFVTCALRVVSHVYRKL